MKKIKDIAEKLARKEMPKVIKEKCTKSYHKGFEDGRQFSINENSLKVCEAVDREVKSYRKQIKAQAEEIDRLRYNLKAVLEERKNEENTNAV